MYLLTEDEIKMRYDDLFRSIEHERAHPWSIASKPASRGNLLNSLGDAFISFGKILKSRSTSA